MVILLIGLTIFIAGALSKYFHDDYKHYPGLAIGYKTKYAMKDKDTWIEANNYFFKVSIISLIFSLLFIIITNFLDSKIINIIHIPVILLIFFTPIFLTEIHLRKFNKNK